MRRSDKEINDLKTIQKILKEAKICRIALVDGNEPYIVPMSYGYKNNALYFHSANEGRKIDILRKNNRVCFQMDIKMEIVTSDNPCNWGMKYLSVVGFGKAQIIENHMEKNDALDTIMAKYSPENSYEYSDKAISKVIIIRVEIEEITGKKSGY